MNSIYRIQFSKAAYKYFSKLDRKKQKQIAKVLDTLKQNPFIVSNVKPIQGINKDMYRIRIGDLRIIYCIENEKLLIFIIKIGPRGDIYK